ncbi:MAG TPA: glycerol kinase GlpK [Opitutaceae bacterium]|jgi:glycerol kinase|nr:glycerol kinase GlpK [Opitutaceae bacterium]
MKRCVLALDQGTTSSRAILFDRKGRGIASAQVEFRQHFPQPGWVEHDAEDLWETTRRVALAAMRKAGVSGSDIAAIGIANQRETTVLWDRRTGKAVHRAIVWQDRRTSDACSALDRRGLGPLFRKKTGLIIDPYFSGTKLAWLLDHVPGARARAARGELAFGTVDTWILWKLTGGRVHATDVSNASRTLMASLAGEWDGALTKILRIPRSVLPEIRDSSGVFGEVSSVAALRGVPISGIAGDQQAALFGQGCFSPGMAKNTYGTGCFMLMNTGTKPVFSRNRLLSTIAWRIGGRTEYALEGSVFVGGAVVQWLRDGLGLIKDSKGVEDLASKVPNNGGVTIVPAFAGLGAPHWDPGARGAIVGVTRGTSAAHLARAALESIALQTADLIGAMESDSGRRIRELRVDGGASVNDALMQFQSELLRTAVTRPRVTETTALGAAALAGLAVGFWKDKAEIGALAGRDRTFRHRLPAARLRAARAQWSRAVDTARHWSAR